jgi:hypothetical protein
MDRSHKPVAIRARMFSPTCLIHTEGSQCFVVSWALGVLILADEYKSATRNNNIAPRVLHRGRIQLKLSQSHCKQQQVEDRGRYANARGRGLLRAERARGREAEEEDR